MKHWIIVIIAIALFFLHERLSATKYFFFGGILPFAGIGVEIYQLIIIKTTLSTTNIIAYIVFFAVSFLLWIVGRYEYKQKEINKMKAKDIQ